MIIAEQTGKIDEKREKIQKLANGRLIKRSSTPYELFLISYLLLVR